MLLQLFVPHSFTYKLQYFNVYQVQKNRLGGWTTVKIVRKAALYNRGKIHSFRHLRLLYNFFFIIVPSQSPAKNLDSGADAILSELLTPKENKMASMSRTQQKLALQREHLLKQEQKKKEQERQRQLEQSSEISIPFPRPTETLPPHIPPAVLNVREEVIIVSRDLQEIQLKTAKLPSNVVVVTSVMRCYNTRLTSPNAI
jgi:hypothetical protein